MESSNNEASRMENGEAGLRVDPTVISLSEKQSNGVSPTTTSSTKTLVPGPARFKVAVNRIWSGMFEKDRPAPDTEDEESVPYVRTLETSPCGYPSVATFLDSDENFMMYRRFGFLQSRLLLQKQDELRKLEDALDKMDQRETRKDDRLPMTTNLTEEDKTRRLRLLSAIEEKFCAYAKLLDLSQKLVAMNRPANEDYQSLQNFMESHNPLMEGEDAWIYHKEDMVTLRAGREHAWLDSGIEKVLKRIRWPLIQHLFGDKYSQAKSSDLGIYYARDKISRLATCIIAIMIVVLLIVPIYTLYHLVNDIHTDKAYAICMGILVISTLAFSAVLSLFTKAKRHEILAAAAAYCAVLVVFLGNVGPNSLPGLGR